MALAFPYQSFDARPTDRPALRAARVMAEQTSSPGIPGDANSRNRVRASASTLTTLFPLWNEFFLSKKFSRAKLSAWKEVEQSNPLLNHLSPASESYNSMTSHPRVLTTNAGP